jgi:hypothetical protein
MPDCSFPSLFPFFCFAALFFGSIIVQVQDMLIHLHDNNSKKINTMHQEFKIGTNYRKEIISRIKPLIPMSSPLTSDRPKSEGHTCLISYNIFMDLSICLIWTFFNFLGYLLGFVMISANLCIFHSKYTPVMPRQTPLAFHHLA